MKTKVYLLVAILFGTLTATGQTWLEKSLNSQTLTSPPSSGSENPYAEPFDTTWRRGNVGIGIPDWPQTKLHVGHNDDATSVMNSFLSGNTIDEDDISGIFTNGGTSSNFTIASLSYAEDINNTSDNTFAGICAAKGNSQNQLMGMMGFAEGDDAIDQITGVHGTAEGDGNAEVYGVHGKAVGTNNPNDGFNFGVHGSAEGDSDSENSGVHGQAKESADINYGVWGEACNGNVESYGVYGVACTTGTSYAGYFDGDVHIEGDATTTGTQWSGSDKKLKENVKEYKEALTKLRQIGIRSYKFKEEYADLGFPESEQIGLIAQELERVYPHLTKDTKAGRGTPKEREFVEFKAVNYTGLIPILIRAVQELDEKVTALEKENERLKEDGSETVDFEDGLTGVTDYAENANSMTLMPNPSNDIMRVNVATEYCNNCMLMITDMQGKLVTKVSVSSNGAATIDKAQVGEGIFLCNLIVDGRPVSTERIVFL